MALPSFCRRKMQRIRITLGIDIGIGICVQLAQAGCRFRFSLRPQRWQALSLFSLLLSLGSMSMAVPNPAQAQQPPSSATEYAIKSALLFKLPRFIYLPKLADDAALQLCVLGENPFGGALHKLAQTPIDGRQITVRQFADSQALEQLPLDCHLLFVTRSETARLAGILQQLKQAPTVTISDIEGFAKAGGMVEMALNPSSGSALNILINRKAAQAQHIDFNAQLLRLASLIES